MHNFCESEQFQSLPIVFKVNKYILFEYLGVAKKIGVRNEVHIERFNKIMPKGTKC